MLFQTISPSASLATFVKHYRVLEASNNDMIIKERVIPTGAIEIRFHYRNLN